MNIFVFTIYFPVDYSVLQLLWINEGMTCWDCCQQSVGNHAPNIAPFFYLDGRGRLYAWQGKTIPRVRLKDHG